MKRLSPVILALFLLGGFAGLLYELVWMRLLSHVLGGATVAVSTVLAAFMGGLALGSRTFGRRADHTARPLRLYGRLELGIAILGALAPVLIRIGWPVYAAATQVVPDGALFLLRALFAAVVVLPPAFLMGGTLPVLGRTLVQRRERLGREVGLLYAVNTLGAVLGAFLTGYVLIEALGLAWCTALAAGVNIVIGLTALGIDRGLAARGAVSPGDSSPSRPPSRTSGARPEFEPRLPAPEIGRVLLVLAFAASGFASLGYEVYWTRALQLFLGNSTYAFSAMLTTFLLGLAGGSWTGGLLADRARFPGRLLGWVQIMIGAAALATVWLIWTWLPGVSDGPFLNPRGLGWTGYVFRRFLVAFAIMTPPSFLIGLTFPLVNRIGIRHLRLIGAGIGALYFANTLGAILGSLAAGLLLLPWLGTKGAILLTAGLNVAIGLGVLLARRPRRLPEIGLAGAAVVAVLVAAPLLARSGRSILSRTQDPADEVLFQREDSVAETRVYRKADGALHMSVDGHDIGGSESSILRKQKVLAHLPMALVPGGRDVLAIGLGSGITLGSFALHREIESLVCVEIVPGVVSGADRFREHHGNVLADPRVEIHVVDGVQYLLTCDRRFDVISSDSKLNPYYVGNSALLAREYYALCRRRLKERGVMVQWLALHLPLSELQAIVRSFAAGFPHVALFWHDPYNIVLAGSPNPIGVDLDRIRAFAGDDRLRDDLTSVHLEDPYVLASLFVSGEQPLREAVASAPMNTWSRPRLEFSILRASLEASATALEDETLAWLLAIRSPEEQVLRGKRDEATLVRYRNSSEKLLEGYAAGGGIAILATGTGRFQEGLEQNPADRRLRQIVDFLARESARRPGPGPARTPTRVDAGTCNPP